jgi:hypothetical protein
MQPCGQCSTPQCDTVTGQCVGGSNGCLQWYTGNYCNISIGRALRSATDLLCFYFYFTDIARFLLKKCNNCAQNSLHIISLFALLNVVVTCTVQDLTVNILTNTSAQVTWTCAGLSNIPSQFYYFSINSSAMSAVINSSNQSVVISGALPPTGVYDMSVTVTMCRTQYSVTNCTAGQTARTSCGG